MRNERQPSRNIEDRLLFIEKLSAFAKGKGRSVALASTLILGAACLPSETASSPIPPRGAEVSPLPSKPANAEVRKISTREEAAKRFGADSYSSNPKYWEINEYGGAHLIESSDDVAHRVNLSGAVFEGWIKANTDPKNTKFKAETVVVSPKATDAVDAQGGTLWDFVDSDAGFRQLLAQVKAKELIEQPGVIVLSVCLPSETKNAPTPTPTPTPIK